MAITRREQGSLRGQSGSIYRKAALRGWCWEHGQELVAAERSVQFMSDEEIQQWAELARENRVQVTR